MENEYTTDELYLDEETHDETMFSFVMIANDSKIIYTVSKN
jgi:hypothetical protein